MTMPATDDPDATVRTPPSDDETATNPDRSADSERVPVHPTDSEDEVDDSSGRIFVSAAARRGAAVRALAVAAVVAVPSVALLGAVPELMDPAWVRGRVEVLGPLAPLGYVLLQTIQVIVAPVPGQVVGGVGGYLFGPLAGATYSMIGVLAGSAVVFVATRQFGRPYVERVVDTAALDRWDRFVADRGLVGLFVVLLLPGFPDDLLCFVAGLSRLRLRTFLLLVAVGRTPSFLAVAYAGTALAEGATAVFAVSVVAIAVASITVYAARERVFDGIDAVT